MFPMCSHEVPQFLKLFPQNDPTSTSALSHMVCPKFNSHLYKLKKVDHREHICFYFAIGGPMRCITQCSKKIGDEPINMAPYKIKKS
jgi:hypothetical protein